MKENGVPKLKLHKDTVRILDGERLAAVHGGLQAIVIEPETRGFTNCDYCGLTRISPRPCFTDHCSYWSACC